MLFPHSPSQTRNILERCIYLGVVTKTIGILTFNEQAQECYKVLQPKRQFHSQRIVLHQMLIAPLLRNTVKCQGQKVSEPNAVIMSKGQGNDEEEKASHRGAQPGSPGLVPARLQERERAGAVPTACGSPIQSV